MTTAPEMIATRRNDSSEWGWYLYGITASAPDSGLPETGQRLERIRYGDLDAIARRVPRVEFTEAVLGDRLRDPRWLEAIVRQHHEVVAAVHARQAILPAKFGCVYASTEDLAPPLERARAALLDQLKLVELCDEWAVHVYVDPHILQQHTLAGDPSLGQLQQELAKAPPGRAHLLRRKLKDELARSTRHAQLELARTCYERLVHHTVAQHVSQPRHAEVDAEGQMEVVRAAFLVRRADTEAFVGEAAAMAQGPGNVRCDWSGPWPPYSFVGLDGEDRR